MFCKTCLIFTIQNMSRNAYARFPPHLDIFPPHAIPPYGGEISPPIGGDHMGGNMSICGGNWGYAVRDIIWIAKIKQVLQNII